MRLCNDGLPVTAIASKSPALPPCVEGTRGAATSPCAPGDRKWVLVATILGSSLAFMDGSVVNVALPTLQSAFGATSGGIQWVVQSYALFGAALLLLGGAIGDRYGRRRAFVWGVAVFALASAACAGAQTLGQLIAARSMQGIGAALLVPQGLSILSASFAEEERSKAIGTWSAWTSVFAALGPVAGGWLMQVWSWRLIFLLNLPIAILVLTLSRRIPESRALGDDGMAKPLDRLGATLNTFGLAAVIYALSFAPQLGWRDLRVAGLFLAGAVLLALFLWSQSKRTNAMMPLSLFASRRFLAANLLTFLLYGALSGSLYTIPFYLIQVRHYAPSQAGAVFLPLIALMFFFSGRVGALVPKLGEPALLFAGALLSGFGFAAFALLDGQHGYASAILPGVLLLGVGLTLAVAPLSTAVMSSVQEGKTGIASAVNNAISRLAGLLAVSLLSLVLLHGFQGSLRTQLDRSDVPESLRQEILANSARMHETPVPAQMEARQSAEVALFLDRAFLRGFRVVMLVCAASAWAGALAVIVLSGGQKSALDQHKDVGEEGTPA